MESNAKFRFFKSVQQAQSGWSTRSAEEALAFANLRRRV